MPLGLNDTWVLFYLGFMPLNLHASWAFCHSDLVRTIHGPGRQAILGLSVLCPLGFMPFGSGQNCLQYQLAGDKVMGLACECLYGLVKLWIQVLFIWSHFVWGLSMVIVLCLYFCAIMGCSVLTPEGSPLCWILIGCFIMQWLKRNWFSIVTLLGLCIL